MAAKDPFAGIHLSEQAVAPKLDQRLFAREPVPTKKPTVPPNPAPTPAAPSAEGPLASPVSTRSVRDVKPGAPLRSLFDLDDEPFHKASYLFTLPEKEALEDLKLELGRELDTKVTKNDIVRSAVHLLVEDYRANGAKSYVRKKIRSH